MKSIKKLLKQLLKTKNKLISINQRLAETLIISIKPNIPNIAYSVDGNGIYFFSNRKCSERYSILQETPIKLDEVLNDILDVNIINCPEEIYITPKEMIELHNNIGKIKNERNKIQRENRKVL